MDQLEHKRYLYKLSDLDGSSRMVYCDSRDVLVIETPYADDPFKKSYNVFVQSYQQQGFFHYLRGRFLRFQAGLYTSQRNPLLRLAAYLTTPVPPVNGYGNFLDVGCNTGAFLSKIPDPWKRFGVEINHDAFIQSKYYPNISVQNCALEQYRPLVSFQYVRLSHVIEHIKDEDAFLQSLTALMDAGSYALLYTPNTRSISRWLFGKHWCGFHEKTHVKLYNLKNLTSLCSRYGFTTVASGTYYMGMTAGSLVHALKINTERPFGHLAFLGLVLLFYPFSFIANALRIGGALYLYVKKNQ